MLKCNLPLKHICHIFGNDVLLALCILRKWYNIVKVPQPLYPIKKRRTVTNLYEMRNVFGKLFPLASTLLIVSLSTQIQISDINNIAGNVGLNYWLSLYLLWALHSRTRCAKIKLKRTFLVTCLSWHSKRPILIFI